MSSQHRAASEIAVAITGAIAKESGSMAFVAEVASVDASGKVAVIRAGAAGAGMAFVVGPDVVAGDDVLCIKAGGQPFVIGKVTKSHPALMEWTTTDFEINGDLTVNGDITVTGSGLGGGGSEVVFVADSFDSAITSSNTSSSTFEDAISLDITLPTGTWTVLGVVLPLLAMNADAGSIELRCEIDGNQSGSVNARILADNKRSQIGAAHSVSGLSSGTKAITAIYRRNDGTTAYCGGGTVLGIGLRTA